jgi:hypothetical protein
MHLASAGDRRLDRVARCTALTEVARLKCSGQCDER